MEDSGAILYQLSAMKDLLDKVNEEIEDNIQVTREIESEIVKCSEIEVALGDRESELMKMVYLSQFELNGLISVAVNSRNLVQHLGDEVDLQRKKKSDLIENLNRKREIFTASCTEFQRTIDKGENDELRILLLEKEYLENEVHVLDQRSSTLQNSMSAFVEEILDEFRSSNSVLQAEIDNANAQNERLLKEIDQLRTKLLLSGPPAAPYQW